MQQQTTIRQIDTRMSELQETQHQMLMRLMAMPSAIELPTVPQVATSAQSSATDMFTDPIGTQQFSATGPAEMVSL